MMGTSLETSQVCNGAEGDAVVPVVRLVRQLVVPRRVRLAPAEEQRWTARIPAAAVRIG